MSRRYYTSRNKPVSLTLSDLYQKLQNLYLLFRDRDYFKGKAGIRETVVPDAIKREAALALTFQPFPITGWPQADITEDHVFDAIEFLYNRVSKPGNWDHYYFDYDGYDDEAGRKEFRETANAFLSDYRAGYELTEDGTILALGTHGLRDILDADILPYDEANVDSKVRSAILKWRNRHLAVSEKKEAIRELADVFEWLKKTQRLDGVLDRTDEAAIFDIANKFEIRHHNPQQKTDYDRDIWYPWIFHFYLATYHAVVRLLARQGRESGLSTNTRTLQPRNRAGG